MYYRARQVGAAHRAAERDGGRRRGRALGGPSVPGGRRGGGRRRGGHCHARARPRRRAGRIGAPARGAGDELHRHSRRRRHVHQRSEVPAARLVAVDKLSALVDRRTNG